MKLFLGNLQRSLPNPLRRLVAGLKHPTFLASVVVAGAIAGIRLLGGLQSLELLTYDQMIRLRPDVGTDPRLLVVAITENDIRNYQRWPLSDALVAKLLATLQASQPRVIGLDLYRDLPQPPGQSALEQQLRAENVIAVYLLGNEETSGVPAPRTISVDRTGFSDFVVDPDAVVRRNLLFARSEGDRLYSFGLRLSLQYLQPDNLTFQDLPHAVTIGEVAFPSLTPEAGSYQNLDDRGYQVLLNYRSANQVARQVSLTQVLSGKVDPEWIRDKIVLVGTTAPSAKDLFVTPYNLSVEKSASTPGVMVHAQVVSQILSRMLENQSLIWFWSEGQEIFWIWGWSLAGALLAWRFRHPVLLGSSVAIAAGMLTGGCFLLFLQSGWVPLVPAMIGLVGSSVVVVVYKRLYEAFHDALTGLPNRALFMKQLQWAIAQPHAWLQQSQLTDASSVAVLFLGLDSFKAINDSFGHRMGDQLLVNITQRLKNCLHTSDQLARVGGDEFAVLRQGVMDTDDVTHLADLLQRQVTQPFKLDGREVFTTASVGIVLGSRGSEYGPEDLLRDAHTAMHRAKSTGKARHEVFVRGMRDQVMTRLQLETDLRHAIIREEFRLYYQPLINLQTGTIAGFEALVRWQHPQRGFVSPGDFIPVAEETDLIIPMGKWILWEACRQLKLWQQQFSKNPPLMVSVNLSGKQFTQPDLVDQVRQTLEEFNLDGYSLKLEITESIAMTDVEATIATLLQLKALNLQLSIDDFGTGYSSLSYLHRFPTSTIKVDRSFVSRMGDQSEDAHIVQTIIMLGHNLGMDIVAEGVETAEQLENLRRLHCEYGQGYYFSRPVAVDAIEALLKTSPQW